MFHRPEKKGKLNQTKPLKDLIEILSPQQLLADEKRQCLIQKIQRESAASAKHFEQNYQSLIDNFIAHVQSLPETSNSYYASTAGLLDHALNRTEAAVELFREYMILEDNAELSEEQQLWMYVLFSAGILQGVGKLQIDYQVNLFDRNGQKIKPWNPLLESLVSSGQYYDYHFMPEQDPDFRRRLNLLLARLLMPAKGFARIAANPEALAIWLALLHEDWQSAGILGAILIRADAIAIQRYLAEFLLEQERQGRTKVRSKFLSTPDSIEEKEMLTGIEFIHWLNKALENGQIKINKAPLFSVPGGMLMNVEVFKLFMREHPEYKNWQAVHKGFLALGLHKTGSLPGGVSRFEQHNNQQMLNGILMDKFAVALPQEVTVHDLNTGKHSKLSATVFIQQAQFEKNFIAKELSAVPSSANYLAADGRWQTTKEHAASPSPIGSPFGG